MPDNMVPTLVVVDDRPFVCCTLKKRARKRAQRAGKGGSPTGHPTKKHTAWRRGQLSVERTQRVAAARMRYEHLLAQLYRAAMRI